MKNQVQNGDAIYVAAPTGGVVSGQGYLIGTMFGVSPVTAPAGTIIALWLVGCYSLAKVSAQAWTVGATIYWDNTAFNCTTVSASNTKIGVAIAAAANPSAVGSVRLNGSF
jgi:predicted RecA/RadA family phage recombinase